MFVKKKKKMLDNVYGIGYWVLLFVMEEGRYLYGYRERKSD